jgi:RimJ/RimL family protein N-acetyltransferase
MQSMLLSTPAPQPSQAILLPPAAQSPATAWRHAVPVLHGRMADIRAIERDDAPALLALLTTEEVSRFGTSPPATLEGFESFIAWSTDQRAEGRHICFSVIPHGFGTAVGLLQVRSVEQGFQTAEWGFALGSAFWGTGLFMDAARLVLDFVFDTLGAHRLEARAAVTNGRGNGALRKLGAVQEGVLRRAHGRDGHYIDQALWSILDEEWRQAKATWGRSVLVH